MPVEPSITGTRRAKIYDKTRGQFSRLRVYERRACIEEFVCSLTKARISMNRK